MGSIPVGGFPPSSPGAPSIPSGSGTTSTSSAGSPDTINPSIQLSAATFDDSSFVSLISIVKSVGDIREALRDALHKSMVVNDTITSGFTLAAAMDAALILTEFEAVINTVNRWNASIESLGKNIVNFFPSLEPMRTSMNNEIVTTENGDQTTVNYFNFQNINGNPNWINGYLSIYKNPATFNAWALANFPSGLKNPAQALAASQQSGINFLNNNVVSIYNQWFGSVSNPGWLGGAVRPRVQFDLTNYADNILSYNIAIDQENSYIAAVNQERATYGMPPLQMLQNTENPSSNINSYLTYLNGMPASLPTLSLPPNSTPVNLLTAFPSPSGIVPLPDLTNPLAVDQKPPRASLSEAMSYILGPLLSDLFSSVTSINRSADLFHAQADQDSEAFKSRRVDITVSNAYVQQQATVSSAGAEAAGLSAFAMGPQTKNLQIALSTALFRAVAANAEKPIADRLFAQLGHSALQILQNSALMSAVPAMRNLASALGLMTSATASISVSVSLAILEQIGALIDLGGPRSVVNLLLNQLPQYARLRSAAADQVVAQSENNLNGALASGNQDLINGAANDLTNAQVIASRAQQLQQTFGSSSVGDIAQLTNATSAAMAISLLSVGAALLGRALGILDLSVQLFGNINGAPATEMQAFLSAGTSMTDALDNPLNVLSLKQEIADILAGKGIGADVAELVNAAINQVIAQGGIQGLGDLKAALFEAFKGVLNPIQANGLTNQVAGVLFGNLGFPFSNASFGLNYPISHSFPTLAGNTGGGTETQAILEQSVKNVGANFQAQGEFRDALYKDLQNNGIESNQAMYLANGVATFGLTGVIPSINASADYLKAVQKLTENQLSDKLGVSQADANRIYDQAKQAVLQQGPLNTLDQFHLLMMEELNKATNGIVAAQMYKSALAEADTAHELVKEEALKGKIKNKALEILEPELGARIAEEIANKIIKALFGAESINEAGKQEKSNPLSATNRAEKALHDLKKDQDEKLLKEVTDKVAEMIAVWVKPNAELGFLQQTLMDKPSTFIGSLVGPQKPKGEFLDIPV